jgi:hypothetical protein
MIRWLLQLLLLIFADGQIQKLRCIAHVDGASEGWTLIEIGPADAAIHTFDVFEDASKTLHFAIAATQSNGTTVVEYASHAVPTMVWNSKTSMVEGFNPKGTFTAVM